MKLTSDSMCFTVSFPTLKWDVNDAYVDVIYDILFGFIYN